MPFCATCCHVLKFIIVYTLECLLTVHLWATKKLPTVCTFRYRPKFTGKIVPQESAKYSESSWTGIMLHVWQDLNKLSEGSVYAFFDVHSATSSIKTFKKEIHRPYHTMHTAKGIARPEGILQRSTEISPSFYGLMRPRWTSNKVIERRGLLMSQNTQAHLWSIVEVMSWRGLVAGP